MIISPVGGDMTFASIAESFSVESQIYSFVFVGQVRHCEHEVACPRILHNENTSQAQARPFDPALNIPHIPKACTVSKLSPFCGFW